MAVRLAQRGQVPPFRAMDILKPVDELKAQGRETFLLCLGQPSTPAPAPVLAAAEQALQANALGYTAANGLPALRERIARHYADTYGASVNPDHIVVTTGSSAAFTAIFLAAFAPGDAVVLTRPGYPAYRNTLSALGCRVLDLDCGPATRWQPTVQLLDALMERKGGKAPAGLIIASPANPTGTILGERELGEICAWCDEHGVLLISDEIYHGISYGAQCASATQFAGGAVARQGVQAPQSGGTVAVEANSSAVGLGGSALGQSNITVGSFSKYYSMTGWRLGWAVLPEPLVRPAELLLGNLNLSAPTLSQIAALAAFSEEAVAELDRHVQRYRENRDIVLSQIAMLDCPQPAPADGAFYCYLDVSAFTGDSTRFAQELLQATGVAVTPGVDFAVDGTGSAALDGSRFVRISYAGDTATVREGMRRLVEYVNGSEKLV